MGENLSTSFTTQGPRWSQEAVKRVTDRDASIKLRLGSLHPKFEYRYENYGRIDFQLERLNPYMVPLDASASAPIYLGADVPGYKAHILAAILEYRF